MHRNRKNLNFFGLWLLVTVLSISAENESAQNDCSKVECKGPIRYYEDLKCKPIYPSQGNKCCPTRYDCSNIQQTVNKCFANGNSYEIDQRLKDVDQSDPCDVDCVCRMDQARNEAKFSCGEETCTPNKVMKGGCYMKRKLGTCCQMKKVCKSIFPFRNFKCKYDNQTLKEGAQFRPRNTNMLCQCEKGFKGKLELPYCRNVTCGNEIKHISEVRKNCAPVYYDSQAPNQACNYNFRCPKGNEQVKEESKEKNDENVCTFGKLKLHVGDKLADESGKLNECLRCECEVPPSLTCYESTYLSCRSSSNDNQMSINF